MTDKDQLLQLLQEIVGVEGVRGAMIASADGPVGGVEYSHLQPAVAADVTKTVRRMVVASTTANAPLRELLINFGGSRMMIRPYDEDATLVVVLERGAQTSPLRALLDIELEQLSRAAEPSLEAFGVHEGDDEVSQLLASSLGPALLEIEAVYASFRQRVGLGPEHAREAMHEQIREWLLCCNPSTYTLPLLLDGLSETMTDDPAGRSAFVGEVQGILRRAGALR
ncbi:roadblock/LC7 domain-containing protein [Pseudenhygromyxa sp. WMMC2535]|uniref:roadblock/LC7 domain-containing protein n=1 Tax=Pseudenhygromyxa sp. WMMC2535 TaxID=2712867 RepID=UPI0015573DA3|nr:roadblock/LC7 domain-containing protein [Pseudenhygromyxa sp. WMMC2535]NVB38136.1 roadblock/LC7 domain-containing protein [Pseudenhygromyxa sp. WMMC2535]